MLILPAIDLLDGECVRLRQGDYTQVSAYSTDPVAVARQFADQGAKWIHIVDLDGARTGTFGNLGIVSRIVESGGVSVEFGGGIRSINAAQSALDAGVSRFVVGSKVVQDPILAQELFHRFGDQAVAGLDARNGKVAIAGWTETSEFSVENVAIQVEGYGAKRIILTDIARDGMLEGPNIDLLDSVLQVTSIPIIQSGGIRSVEDLRPLTRRCRPVEGVIVGKAIYENRFNLRLATEEFQAPPQIP